MDLEAKELKNREKNSYFLVYIILITVATFLPLSFARATSIGTNVTVTGTTNLNGNTTIGDSATADTLTVTARLAADLDPNANNTIDLGAFGLAYNNIFASGTSYLGSVTSTMISPWANNTSDLGAYGNAWKNLYASSTVFLTSVSTTQGIEAAPDIATNFIFGKMRVDALADPFSDILAISHYDNTAIGDTALLVSSVGETILNSKTGQNLGFAINADYSFHMSNTKFYAADGGGAVMNETPATTNPTLIPDTGEETAGIGGGGGALSIITGGVERINFGNGGNISVADIIFPGTNNTYDLGTTLNSWKNIHVTSTAFVRFVSSTLIEPYSKNSHDMGSYKLPWRNIYASSTAFLGSVTTTQITPWANNTSNLGQFGSAWKNIYASSTLYLGASGATSTIISNVNGSGSAGQGTCLELTASDGTIMYCSVLNSASTDFTCSTTSCK